jgi:hypothetical protein
MAARRSPDDYSAGTVLTVKNQTPARPRITSRKLLSDGRDASLVIVVDGVSSESSFYVGFDDAQLVGFA